MKLSRISGLLLFCVVLLSFVPPAELSARDIGYTRPIGPGVKYIHLRRTEGPWEVRIFRIDRSEKLVHLDAGLGGGTVKGVQTVTGIADRVTEEDDYPIAATNADFFAMAGHEDAGTPCGMVVIDGRLIMDPRGRAAFAMLGDGTPSIGHFDTGGYLSTEHGTVTVGGENQRLYPDTAILYTEAWGWPICGPCAVLQLSGGPLQPNGNWDGFVMEKIPAGETWQPRDDRIAVAGHGNARRIIKNLTAGAPVSLHLKTDGLDNTVKLAVGGGPIILRNGKVLPDHNSNKSRHPRTAIGYNDSEIVLATVDGRQAGWSVGMTLHRLAAFMKNLGCTDALNLDGGGSTTAWVRGRVVNRPSDGCQRPVANAILVRSTAPHGPPALVTVRPKNIVALAGASVPLHIWTTDKWYNPTQTDLSRISIADVTATGKASRPPEVSYTTGKLNVGQRSGDATVRIQYGNDRSATAEMALRVITHCAQFTLVPSVAHLVVGETAQFSSYAFTKDGTRVWTSDENMDWQTIGGGVAHRQRGAFEATRAGAKVTVRASVQNCSADATIHVGESVQIEGFEASPDISFAKYPRNDGISGSVKVAASKGADGGNHYCRLRYDLGRSHGTRAAYLRLERQVGSPLQLSASIRGANEPAAWVRTAVIDGNGTRHLYTLTEGLGRSWQWRRFKVRLPEGLKAPIKWQAIYVVATDGDTAAGYLDIDNLRAVVVRN